VGGDLYDYYHKGDDLFFIIGDVSGKGVSAAMFMSATVNLFRSAVLRLQSPKSILEEVNSVLSEHNPSLMFVTAIIGRLNMPTGQLWYCNAGHLPPLVDAASGNGQRCLKEIAVEPNIPLGYDGKFRFVEQATMLRQGDTLVLYTDGITEARNKNNEMLGMERWKAIVAGTGVRGCGGAEVRGCEGTPEKLGLLADVRAYIGEAEQKDDITLLTIRKTSETQPVALRVPNRTDQWPLLRAALQDYGMCVGVDARTLKKMIVALEEAVVNIINYSQADYISLTIFAQTELTITLTDNGVAFDPTALPETDTDQVVAERQIGGLGIALLRQIADKIEYHRTDGQNELIIIKNI
jgi:sigma-B regulation protein RsbU (phosphoserine phosphatase)